MINRLICILVSLPVCVFAQTAEEIAALENQKKAAELIKAIETAKADTAIAKRNQLLSEAATETSFADERKKQAEAEKSELAAKLPATNATALQGTVNLDGVKLMALAPIIKRLDAEALKLCGVLRPTKEDQLLFFDRSLIDGILAARLLEKQLENLKMVNENAVIPPAAQPPTLAGRTAALLGVAAVTTGLKAVADLAALFKTNVTTNKVDLADAKAAFQTMVAGHCGGVLAIPGGYIGELDETTLNELIAKLDGLMGARTRTSIVVAGLKKQSTEMTASFTEVQGSVAALEKKVKDGSAEDRQKLSDERGRLANIKKQLDGVQDRLAPLEELLKQTDAFVLALKTLDTTGTGPISIAARFLQLNKRVLKSTTRIVDVDVKAEGITIVKDNLFAGQRLRLGGAAVLSYRVMEIDGTLLLAKVEPFETEFSEVDLRKPIQAAK